jgi:alkylation response protein AidB-like acyl-CoA dehydrogenase
MRDQNGVQKVQMYRLNAAQAAIVETLTKLADRDIRPHGARVDAQASFPAEAIESLRNAGYMGLTVPTEYGGMGQGPRVACAVLDAVAQRCASTAMVYLMHLAGVAAYAAAPATPAGILRAVAAGQHLTTLAWSEFGSRSHFWAPVSQEVPDGDRVKLSASKSFVTSAGVADSYIVSTKWAEASTPTDSMLYYVLKEDTGIRISAAWDGMGLRGNMSGPMQLDEVAIPSARALSQPGKGLDVMLASVLPIFNLGSAAVSAGIAEASFQAAQKHITEARFEYTMSTLADLPNERTRLADMRIGTDSARSHLSAAIDAVENPGPTTLLLVLEAKACASEAAVRVTDLALRACGGTGFAKHIGVERNFRDARAAAVMAPTTDVLHEFIGRALCGMDVFG